MKLPVPSSAHALLLKVFSALEEKDGRPVLVGGLVPPLLLATLDPDRAKSAPEPRRTADCDICVHLSLDTPERRRDDLYETLRRLGLVRDERVNQFCWRHHADKLRLDVVPVPSGVERKDPQALAFATLLGIEDAGTFYRGAEAAFVDYEEIVIDGSMRLRIAGLLPLLAMKLQAWTDRRWDRKRDAQDVAWLFRNLRCDTAAASLHRGRLMHPELFAEVQARLRKGFLHEDGDGIVDCFPAYDEAIHARQARAIVSAVFAVLRTMEKWS